MSLPPLRYRCVPFCPKMVAALPKNRQNITFQPPLLPKSGKNGYGSSPTLDLHSSGAHIYRLSLHSFLTLFPLSLSSQPFLSLVYIVFPYTGSPFDLRSGSSPQSTVCSSPVHRSSSHFPISSFAVPFPRSPFHSPVHTPLLPLKLRVPPPPDLS